MHVKKYNRPPLDPRFLNTAVIDWEIRDKITCDHGKYCIRFYVTFQNGEKKVCQTGGFRTKKEASTAKESLVQTLVNHQYIPYKFTAAEFYDYWLYYCMIDEYKISYNNNYQKAQDPNFYQGADYIVTRAHGLPMTRAQSKRFKHVLEVAGLDSSQYTWHDIRHSYATILKDNEINLKSISKILGHASEDFKYD